MGDHSLTIDATSVDVIIAVRNRADEVVAAVRSALGQTFQPVHVIVVDDGSTDDTAAKVEALADPRVSVIRQAHAGPSAARNCGVRAGSANAVAFLDSDDVADPEWLAELLSVGHGAAVSCCAGTTAAPTGTRTYAPADLGPEHHHLRGIFMAGLFVVARAVFEEVGGYEESLRTDENTELGFRITGLVHAGGLTIASTQRALVHFARTGVEVRHRYPPAQRRAAAEVILARHGARLATNRTQHAAYLAIAGVNALRTGDAVAARSYLGRAVRRTPRNARYAARLAQATLLSMPFVRRRRVSPAAGDPDVWRE